MNKGLIVAATVAGFVLFAVVSYATINNSEIMARNAIKAQKSVNESSFDKMWKVLKTQAQIPDKERESFRKTYSDIMASSKGIVGSGSLASFLTQAKIDISPQLYQTLMNSIEAQRESFHRDQIKLLQLKQQHDNILGGTFSSLIVGGRPPEEIQIVTSDKTKEVFSSGVDNDTSLF